MSKRRPAHEPPDQAEPNTSSAGQATPPGDRSSAQNGLPVSSSQETANQISASASADPKRAGADTRQRGWYWHWNGIVTQYAPLIGLKGVGLLNSYTVWTDRREQSATRGYAFPSQQSEGDFYGEDRSELITINKILVALDLIEIRKEMVLRTDPQGRKWKVPHNLYRVKDRPEGIELCTSDVLKVAELASRDAAVFRYLKRIFSNRFAPIDRDNVWHQILSEVANDPTWQALTDKTSKIEARASARTRAGHKARGKQAGSPNPAAKDDETNTPDTEHPTLFGPLMTAGHLENDTLPNTERTGGEHGLAATSVASTNDGLTSRNNDVATGNTGLETDVEETNTGLQGGDDSSAEETNTGPASVVARSNATYHQEISTTTTTTTGATSHDRDNDDDARPSQPSPEGAEADIRSAADVEHYQTDRSANAGQDGLDNRSVALPSGQRPAAERESLAAAERNLVDSGPGGPLVDPSPLVVSLFEAANDRRASPLERVLLAELERDAGPVARARDENGADWVAAALREAVSSGSAFVAPKRVREIINRWAAAGDRPQLDLPQSPQAAPGEPDAQNIVRADPVHLPLRRNPLKVWQAVLDDLSRVLDAYSHQRLFAGSCIAGYQRGIVTVQVSAGATEKLAAEYRPLLERHLERHIGKPVTVQLVAAVADDEPLASTPPRPETINISAADAEQGRQLWRAVLSEAATEISADDLARLRGALPLGQNADGHIVIGAPTALAARLIHSRCRIAIETALRTLLGDSATVRVAGSNEWSIVDERSGR
ncbi:MAG: hypothetical protein H0V47_13570 [Chloroflexia bacterium]|nr:hypothetical protein [Chloroflexia bacterium]